MAPQQNPYAPPMAAARQTDTTERITYDFMPFGAGQFYNHKYIFGLVFFATEGGALYYWHTQYIAAQETVATTNAYLLANCTNLNATNTASCQQYAANSATYVNTAQQNAHYSLIGFGVLYVLGVVQAMIDDPPPPPPPKKKKKRRGMGMIDQQLDGAELSEDHVREAELFSFNWRMDLVPTYDPVTAIPEPTVSLQLNWQF